MKKFIYHVNGVDFEDTEAFGKAWKEAEKYAKEQNTYITRTIVEEQYFLKCGAFVGIDENRDMTKDAKIFTKEN